MPGEFNGKVVLITGAASGLGRAASIRFAQEGASLCLVDINADGLSDTVQRIGEMEGGCTTFAADIGTPATCAQAVQTAIDAFGRIDVLCNIEGDRKSVVQVKSVYVRVVLGCSRIIKK